MPMITSGSPKERENEQQDAGQSQSSCSIREIARELAAMGYTNKPARAVFGVRRPRMQVSFLSDCDDVALPRRVGAHGAHVAPPQRAAVLVARVRTDASCWCR